MQIQYTEQNKVQRDIPPAIPAVIIDIHALVSEQELNDCIEGCPDEDIYGPAAPLPGKSLQIDDQPDWTDKKSKGKVNDGVIQPFGRHTPECPESMVIIKIIVCKIDHHEK